MKRLKELMEKRKGLSLQIRALAEKDAPTPEEMAEAEGLVQQREALDRQMALLEAAEPEPRGAGEGFEGGEFSVGERREELKPFANLGEVMLAVRGASVRGGVVDDRLLMQTRAAGGANTLVPSQGGFAVQTDIADSVVKRVYEVAQFAPKCRRVRIGNGSNAFEEMVVDETSRATGSRYGGVRAYWANEAATVTASKPKLTKRRIELDKIMAFYYSTGEVTADAQAMNSVAMQAVPEEIAFALDDALFRGDGAGKPLGILNASSLVQVAKEGSQTADTIVAANVQKMRPRIWSRSKANGEWYINGEITPQLEAMYIAAGSGGFPIYMPPNGLSGSPYGTLYGRPVVETEYNSALGDLGDIAFLDWNEYLLIDKAEGVQGSSSLHVEFLTDQEVFRWIYRVNGQPNWASALTPFKGSATLSPFVTLAERA